MPNPAYEIIEPDVLILGSGGAGLCAALHLAAARPPPRVLLAVKGLFGKSGCTRMVQGGYNVVLRAPDSLEAHFRDTIEGGAWLNDQELAWLLVSEAPGRVLELENRVGCFFDRNPDGTVHQKPFAGQRFDRTVHKGDLTGIEIVNRLSEQVAATATTVLEEVRAVELLHDHGRGRVVGALLLDQRTGRFVVAQARATLLATGGGPTMYKIAAPCHDKTCDGIAMAWRAGTTLMDMEMVQFHPTGLMAAGSQITGRCWRKACAARARTYSIRRASATCCATTHAGSAPRGTSSPARATRRSWPGGAPRKAACCWMSPIWARSS